MRIDLFDFLEGLIRGFVYFFYNVVGTLWTLIVHPFRGPMRLYRGYIRTRKREAASDRRQLSAVTCLFLVYFATLGLTGGFANADLNEPVASIAKRGPTLDIAAVWVPVLGAMVITVLIDIALRLTLRLRYFRDARKRQLALPILQYAMILPSIVIAAVPMLGLARFAFSLMDMAPALATLLGWLAAAVLSCVPLAATLIRLPRRGTRLRRTALGWLRWLAIAFAAAMLTFSAGWAGLNLHYQVQEMREDDESGFLKTSNIRCRLDAHQPFVELLAANVDNEPVLIGGRYGPKIVLFDFDDDGGIRNEVSYDATLPGGEDAPAMVIRPKAIEVVRLVPRDFDAAKMPKRRRCRVKGSGFSYSDRMGDFSYDMLPERE
ncbi:MAG: hypothetical protein ACAH11_12155 [Sphingomonas sp.]